MTSTELERTGPLSLLAQLEDSGHATDVGLELTDPEMKFDRWESLGRVLGEVHRRSAWYIGDWINFGEAVYGEDAAQAVEGAVSDRYDVAERVTGLAPSTLMNYASTCTRIARARRRKELPFTVHEVVARLEPDEQVEWLQKAIDEGWTREELRDAIRGDVAPVVEHDSSGGVGGSSLERLTRSEQIEYAAQQVYQQGQPNGSGSFEVPGDVWATLASALGHE